MKDNDNLVWVAIGLAVLVGFFVKKRGSGGNNADLNTSGIPDDCTPASSDSELQGIAKGLKEIFHGFNFYLSDADNNRIKSLFSRLGNSCDYRKMSAYFGTLDSWTKGSGNLDYWMSIDNVDESTREYCRNYAFGLSTF